MTYEIFLGKLDSEQYYSTEYTRKGNQHFHYYRFYDSACNVTREANVKYTNLLVGLQRIVAKSYNGHEIQAYTRKSLNDNFDLLIKDDHTLKMLENICHAVSPE